MSDTVKVYDLRAGIIAARYESVAADVVHGVLVEFVPRGRDLLALDIGAGSGRDAAPHAAQRLDAAAVMINDHTAFRTDWMPFAGRRQSGYGIGGIPWSMHEMSQEKMLVLRHEA